MVRLSKIILTGCKTQLKKSVCFSYEDDIQQFWDKHDGSYDSIIKDHEGLNWEKVVDHDNFKLWRCPVPNSNLYQYRGKIVIYCIFHGSFFYYIRFLKDFRALYKAKNISRGNIILSRTG